MKVSVKRLSENAILPTYATPFAAGADLYVMRGEDIKIPAGTTVKIPLGFSLEIPDGCAGFIYARSGIAAKRGLAPANKVGVIDSDYRGEIIVALHNETQKDETVAAGERIAQLVIAPYLKAEFSETDALSKTQRGEGGFGSTGKN